MSNIFHYKFESVISCGLFYLLYIIKVVYCCIFFFFAICTTCAEKPPKIYFLSTSPKFLLIQYINGILTFSFETTLLIFFLRYLLFLFFIRFRGSTFNVAFDHYTDFNNSFSGTPQVFVYINYVHHSRC